MATCYSFKLSFLMLLLLSPLFTNCTTLPIDVWPKPVITIWPVPKAITFSLNFSILTPPSYHHPHLQSAITRYSKLIFSTQYHPIVWPSIPRVPSKQLECLNVSVIDLSSTLQHDVDESYSLSISTFTGTANLTAQTVWGAIHGLETFSQLTWGFPPIVATDIFIYDRPIFPHRGIMLDTSRNFYPKKDILRTINAMAGNKLNVFHWHIADSQSFPIDLPSEPELAKKGSYGPNMRYTVEDVREIIEYGLDRGVRIMPEIDAPGHAASWAEAYPDIVTCANEFWLPDGTSNLATQFAAEPGTGQLNPLEPKTYKIVKNVIHDIASLFPEQFYHAGGDEINAECWKNDTKIQDFLSKGGTLSQILEIFINATKPFITSQNKTTVYFEDVLLDATIKVSPSSLPTETTILQTWNNGPRNTKLIVQAGYRVIVSSSDFYYLDCGHGDFVGNDSSYDTIASDLGTNGGSWCGPFKTWQRIYDYDITYGLTSEEAKLVIGGEVALWSEQADETVLDARLWPRSSAMAEALWSGNRDRSGKKRYAEATDRLNDWRYRMVGRGIRAEPLQPLWCRKNSGMCNY